MSRLDDAAKLLVIATLLTAMSVFTKATPLTLIALFLGGAMVALGSLYSYRPGAVLGVVIVATGVASSIHLDSVLDVSAVLTAFLGLLLPLFLLALHALGSEQWGGRILPVRGRPAIIALLFCVVCVMSAPMAIGLMSTALPTMTLRLSGTAETAIMLLAATIGSILLTRRTSARRTIGQPAEPEGE
jgi:hypothetical protein